MAELIDHALQRFENVAAIVDDQDPAVRVAVGVVTILRLDRFDRNFDHEAGSLANPALHVELAAQVIDKRTHHSQADTGTLAAPRRTVDELVWGEQRRQQRLWNTRAGVADHEAQT